MATRTKKLAGANDKTPTRLELKAAAIAECRDAQGRVTPQAVVEAARHPDSVLHGEFEWDVNRAAQQAWEARARELIREVKFIVEYEDRKIAAPYYISDPRTDDSGYIPTVKLARNNALKEKVLRDEIARIEGAIRRAMGIAAVFGLTPAFERMLDQVVEIETKIPAAEK